MEDGIRLHHNIVAKKLFLLLISAVICLTLISCSHTYGYKVKKEDILNYGSEYTKRVFLDINGDVPEYIEVTLLINDNLTKEIKLLTEGYSYEQREGLISRDVLYWTDMLRASGKNINISNSEKSLSPKQASDIINKLSNSKKVTLKITLLGEKPFVSDHQLNFSLIDNINPYLKDYKIEHIKTFSEDGWFLYTSGVGGLPVFVYSEVFLLMFDYSHVPHMEYLTIFIDGEYRTKYDFEEEVRYNALHKEITFDLEDIVY